MRIYGKRRNVNTISKEIAPSAARLMGWHFALICRLHLSGARISDMLGYSWTCL